MKSIILDTNVLIDNVHGFATWIDQLLEHTKEYSLIIPTIVISEYLSAQEAETTIGYTKSKEYFSLFKIQDLTFDIAEILGQLLRRKSYPKTASLADLIVAATTIYLDGQLATRNQKDFATIPNLRFFEQP